MSKAKDDLEQAKGSDYRITNCIPSSATWYSGHLEAIIGSVGQFCGWANEAIRAEVAEGQFRLCRPVSIGQLLPKLVRSQLYQDSVAEALWEDLALSAMTDPLACVSFSLCVRIRWMLLMILA